MKHAVKHIHFVGMPGAGPRHRQQAAASPRPTKTQGAVGAMP
jgi:hypothetical protein